MITTGDLTTNAITATITPGYSLTAGINDKEAGIINDALSIYPNSFARQINIKMNDFKPNKFELSVFNVLGAEAIKIIVVQQLTTLETSSLPAGIYFYQVNFNNIIIQTEKQIAQ